MGEGVVAVNLSKLASSSVSSKISSCCFVTTLSVFFLGCPLVVEADCFSDLYEGRRFVLVAFKEAVLMSPSSNVTDVLRGFVGVGSAVEVSCLALLIGVVYVSSPCMILLTSGGGSGVGGCVDDDVAEWWMVDSRLSRLACGGVTVLTGVLIVVFETWSCLEVSGGFCFCSDVVAFWYVFCVPLRPYCRIEFCFIVVVDVSCLN